MNDICWIFTETILGNYADDNTLTVRVWMKTYLNGVYWDQRSETSL